MSARRWPGARNPPIVRAPTIHCQWHRAERCWTVLRFWGLREEETGDCGILLCHLSIQTTYNTLQVARTRAEATFRTSTFESNHVSLQQNTDTMYTSGPPNEHSPACEQYIPHLVQVEHAPKRQSHCEKQPRLFQWDKTDTNPRYHFPNTPSTSKHLERMKTASTRGTSRAS